MEDFKDRVIVVTGSGFGLGKAYAEYFAAHGGRVAIVDMNKEKTDSTVDAIRKSGGMVEGWTVDVSDEGAVNAMAEEIARKLGAVDILVNNAGGALRIPGPVESFTSAEWQRILDVNISGTWFCTRAFLAGMKEKGWGRIINISSTTVFQAIPKGMVPYMTVKAAVIGMTSGLAAELGPFGITCNAIAPGLFLFDKVEHHNAEWQANIKAITDTVWSQQAIRRRGTTDDIVGAVGFLASDAARFITGQVLKVDGGWVKH